MPPFLMLIMVAFAVIMVMFGNNPIDQWKAEAAKYGRDPLARDIKKFNEEREKDGSGKQYKAPPGATLYRLPPNEGQLKPYNPMALPGEEVMIRPAPDVPLTQWDKQYPAYMMAPNNNASGLATGMRPNGENVVQPRAGGTSLMPGFGGGQ